MKKQVFGRFSWLPIIKPFWFRYFLIILSMIIGIFPNLLIIIFISYALHQIQKPMAFLTWQEFFGPTIGNMVQRRFFDSPWHSGLSIEVQQNYFPSLLIATSVFAAFLKIFQEYSLEIIGEKISLNLRKQLTNSFLSLSLPEMLKFEAGLFSSLIGDEIREVRLAFTRVCGSAINDFLLSFVFIAWLVLLHFQLFYVFLAIFVPVGLLIRRLSKFMKRTSKLGLENQTQVLDALLERMKGWETIQTFNKVNFEVTKFEDLNKKLLKTWRKATIAKNLSSPLVEFFGAVCVGFILVLSLRRMIDSDLNSQVLTDIVVTIGLLSVSLQGFVGSLSSSRKGKQSLVRILEFSQDGIPNKPHLQLNSAAPKPSQSYSFQRLSVNSLVMHSIKNNAKHQLCSPISFQLECGDRLLITGVSGVGKSTLLRYLFKLIPSPSNAVMWDFNSPNQSSFEDFCRSIAFLPQDPFIFDGSILENLVYPLDVNLQDEETKYKVSVALKNAQLDKKPEDSVHGLSGGERQRVMFARGFFCESKFWLIDEGTSALDERTEESIFTTLLQSSPAPTIVMVAHRESLRKFSTKVIDLTPFEDSPVPKETVPNPSLHLV